MYRFLPYVATFYSKKMPLFLIKPNQGKQFMNHPQMLRIAGVIFILWQQSLAINILVVVTQDAWVYPKSKYQNFLANFTTYIATASKPAKIVFKSENTNLDGTIEPDVSNADIVIQVFRYNSRFDLWKPTAWAKKIKAFPTKALIGLVNVTDPHTQIGETPDGKNNEFALAYDSQTYKIYDKIADETKFREWLITQIYQVEHPENLSRETKRQKKLAEAIFHLEGLKEALNYLVEDMKHW